MVLPFYTAPLYMAYHFELAGKIIETTQELIFARDQLGLTPLHHMVSIPDAFRHGCDLGMLDSLLYKCVAVEKSLTRPLKKKRSNGESLVSSPDIDFEVYENPNEDHMQDDQPDVEEKNLRNTYGQWVRQLVNNISASIRRKKKGKDPRSDPEAGEDDHHHSFIRHQSELSHYQHSKKHKLFESNFGDDETGGNSNVFSRILLKPSVKWIQKQVYNFMRQTNYWNDLIELKKKHESANNLLTSIAMNQEYWWTLSFGSIPQSRLVSQQKHDKVMERWMETPLTLAATMGLDELVIRILEKHPAAATYRGKEGKNLLHIAVENRQEIIVDMLSWIGREDPRLPLRLKSAKDDNGNTILHLAAMCNNQPGSPLQMSKEFKWFEQVKKILPKDLVNHRNKDGKTAKELFTESHTKMVEDAKAQLTNTASTCCSAMVTAVTFSAGFSIANDNDKKEKIADHRNRVVLKMFSHTYMFGLSCTAAALVQFMALLMASYKEEDFRRSLPTQYKVALATLFAAMMAMVLAFACNTYNSLYNELNPNWKNYLYVAIEVLTVPLICFIALRCGGVKCRVRKI